MLSGHMLKEHFYMDNKYPGYPGKQTLSFIFSLSNLGEGTPWRFCHLWAWMKLPFPTIFHHLSFTLSLHSISLQIRGSKRKKESTPQWASAQMLSKRRARMVPPWPSAVPKSLLGLQGHLPFSHQSAFGLENNQG